MGLSCFFKGTTKEEAQFIPCLFFFVYAESLYGSNRRNVVGVNRKGFAVGKHFAH